MTKPSVMISAGGTGGHLFPALALSEELIRRGYEIDLITDTRGNHYGADFPARAIFKVPSATFQGKSPIEATKTAARLASGFQMAYKILAEAQPKVIIGFGGYPTVPPLLAGLARSIPTAIHEQNAVMGRANRLLAPMVRAIACSFDKTKFLEGKLLTKAHMTGTPLRKSVLSLRGKAYRAPANSDQFKLLIFGGSQGASFFSEIVPPALNLLPQGLRDRLLVIQQCRAEDIDRVFDAYEEAGVAAELATFFDDLPERVCSAHLVLARSGATTVAEVCALGRPAILVPLPHSLDNDQLENATRFERGGGGWCYEQSAMTPERMAGAVRRLFEEPAALIRAAARAQSMAQFDAGQRLADLLGGLIRQPSGLADQRAAEGEKS